MDKEGEAVSYQRAREALARCGCLCEDWDSYGARPIYTSVIRRAEWLLGLLEAAGEPPPDVVPTSDGGIQLEWHTATRDEEWVIMVEEKP